MRIAALFLWIAVPLAIYAGYSIYGLPHIAWTYTFRDNGRPYDPYAKRDYIDCTFWGPYGRFTVVADNGHCPWFKFFREGSGQ
jgi:hypothetical protein